MPSSSLAKQVPVSQQLAALLAVPPACLLLGIQRRELCCHKRQVASCHRRARGAESSSNRSSRQTSGRGLMQWLGSLGHTLLGWWLVGRPRPGSCATDGCPQTQAGRNWANSWPS
jgi:hypothetical protein